MPTRIVISDNGIRLCKAVRETLEMIKCESWPRERNFSKRSSILTFVEGVPLQVFAQIDTKTVSKDRRNHTSLTHFSPVLHFCTPWKRKTTWKPPYGFLMFSGGIKISHENKWFKEAWKQSKFSIFCFCLGFGHAWGTIHGWAGGLWCCGVHSLSSKEIN